MGEGSCSGVPDSGAPLIVDWDAQDRANLEEAMNDGIAVVSYDCKTLKLLTECRVSGGYGYMGVTVKEDVIQLENADELRANLPTFGAELTSELSRSSTLDLGLVMVGKRRTPVRSVTAEEVGASPGCAGATNFVRGAFLGAFSMQTGTRGKVRAVAELFGSGVEGGSNSSKRTSRKDGTLESCSGAKVESASPPSGCASILRLELRKLGAAEAPAGLDYVEQQGCPPGLVPSGGKCTQPKAGLAADCSPSNAGECERQCQRGSSKSCSLLGLILHYGWAGRDKNLSQAKELYEKACKAGVQHGCTGLGIMIGRGEAGLAPDRKKAFELHEKACAAGEPRGCNNLAVEYNRGFVVKRDPQRATNLYQRACNGGHVLACTNLGYRFRDAEGVPRDVDRARQLFEDGCKQGAPGGCQGLGWLYRNGDGVPPDDSQAFSLFRKGCDMEKSATAGTVCHNLAFAYLEGKGIAKDVDKGLAALEKGCKLRSGSACSSWSWLFREGKHVVRDQLRANSIDETNCNANMGRSCSALGHAYLNGLGVLANARKARELFEKGCSLNAGQSCGNLGVVHNNGRGGPRDTTKGKEANEKGCRLGSGSACFNLASMYDGAVGVREDDAKAAEIHTDACERLNHTESCYSAASIYIRGNLERDGKKAAALFGRMCDQKDAEACYEVGNLHARGRYGVQQSDITAASFYRRACDRGYPKGCSALASQYRSGKGVAKDDMKADELTESGCFSAKRFDCGKWSEQFCAKQRSRVREDAIKLCKPEWAEKLCEVSGAMCLTTSLAFKSGQGSFPRDKKKSTKLLEHGCALGHGDVCLNLGRRYEYGDLAPKNKRTALKWFDKGCELKNRKACAAAKKLRN